MTSGADRDPPKPKDPRGGSRRTRRGTEDRDLAGPANWGRIARRGAGNMHAPDPDAPPERPKRPRRTAAETEAEHTGEPDQEQGPPDPPARRLPDAQELRDHADRAVARGRRDVARERRPLPGRPHPRPDAGKAIRRAVGERDAEKLLKRLDQGARAYGAERFADARRALAPVVKAAPDLIDGRELAGMTAYRLGRWDEAIDHLEAFRELSGCTEQHPVLADSHRALGHWSDVEVLWKELGEASPSAEIVTEGRIVASAALADKGDLQAAIRMLEKGWKAPKKPRPHHLRRAYALADLYDRAGRAPRARELFGWVARHDPGLADVRDRVRALG